FTPQGRSLLGPALFFLAGPGRGRAHDPAAPRPGPGPRRPAVVRARCHDPRATTTAANEKAGITPAFLCRNSGAYPLAGGRKLDSQGRLASDDHNVGGPTREQAHANHARSLVERALQCYRVGDAQPVAVQDVIAVVG